VVTATRTRVESNPDDHPDEDTHRLSVTQGLVSEDVWILDYDYGGATVQVRRGRKVGEWDVYSDSDEECHDEEVSEVVRKLVRQRLFMYAKRLSRLPDPVYYVPGRYEHDIGKMGEELGFKLEVVGEVLSGGFL
jgi:hypothetical protein